MNGIDTRYGLGLVLGNTYNPEDDINFYMLSVSALSDYEKVWHHRAPEPLRFKMEYNIGAAEKGGTRFMTSFNIFALYYLNHFENLYMKPYLEGGIGIIYTGFKVKGQGLRINFNPQAGIGAEFKTGSGDTYFLCFRLHHVSNGGLNRDNTGVNSVIFMLGRLF